MSELVNVGVYSTEIDAQMIESRLRAEGIDCFIQKDDVGGMEPNFQITRGVKVKVRSEDLARARQILMVTESGSETDEE